MMLCIQRASCGAAQSGNSWGSRCQHVSAQCCRIAMNSYRRLPSSMWVILGAG